MRSSYVWCSAEHHGCEMGVGALAGISAVLCVGSDEVEELMIILDLKGIKGGEEAQNNDYEEFHCDSSFDVIK